MATAYPSAIVPQNHVEPAPRRVRAMLDGETVFDTTRALYVWEHEYYPQYYIPAADVRTDLLHDDGTTIDTDRGVLAMQSVVVGDHKREQAAGLVTTSSIPGLAMTVRFEWRALDRWFEEDEEVFVHPRSPYVRVDAITSSRPLRVELAGVVLAESPAPVMLFETGLPTRYYVEKPDVRWAHLVASPSRSECPYKGTTSGYWHAAIGDDLVEDVAWSYDFPTRDVLPIAGRIAFYNEKVDLTVDGVRLERPSSV